MQFVFEYFKEPIKIQISLVANTNHQLVVPTRIIESYTSFPQIDTQVSPQLFGYSFKPQPAQLRLYIGVSGPPIMLHT